jgi:hypothetical protein
VVSVQDISPCCQQLQVAEVFMGQQNSEFPRQGV